MRYDHTPMKARVRTWCTALFLGSSLLACATSGDLDKLANRVTDLERERELLRSKLGDDYSKLERLHGMLVEAEETLRKSGAELGTRLERIEQSYPKVRGETESLSFLLKQVSRDLEVVKQELASRLGWTVVYLPPDLPKEKEAIWAAAETRAKSKNLHEAKAIFELYEASHPTDPKAPQALVEIAKLYEDVGDLQNAIKYYQMVYERHEKSPQAASSTLRIAELFVIQRDCERAKSIFKFVETSFKGSPEAAQAKTRQRSLAKECR